MGMFQVKVKVINPAQPERFFEEMFWVDTGALYSFVPEDRLQSIGLKPLRTRELSPFAGCCGFRRKRTLIPIIVGHLFQSNSDSGRSEATVWA